MATANLSVESKDFTLPVVEATAGADGIVVSTLRNDGWVTLDPGFLTTAQCESKITYIDGKNSILRYRGYPIEQLCEQSDFLEVACCCVTANCRTRTSTTVSSPTSTTARWWGRTSVRSWAPSRAPRIR